MILKVADIYVLRLRGGSAKAVFRSEVTVKSAVWAGSNGNVGGSNREWKNMINGKHQHIALERFA